VIGVPTLSPQSLARTRRAGALASHPLARLIVRRLIGLAIVVFVVISATFAMVRLVPGDPLVAAGAGATPTPEQLALFRHEFGFDHSLFHQYVSYLWRVLHWHLGRSYQSDQHVEDLISQRLGTSLQLAGAAFVLVLAASIPLGMLAGAFTREGRHSRFELGFTGVTSVLGSVPDYVTGTVLAFLFAVQFRLLPVAGADNFRELILPAIAVSLAPAMTLARIVRVETLNVLAQDYIRTARSERLPARLVYARHALPNVLTAALTVGGLIFSGIIGGAVIVETVFSRPGLGSALVEAVINKNYPVIQGITIVLGATVVIVTAIVDILLGIVDPRSLAKQG
jgi:peptide/nickel transport system permease protein